MGQRLRRIPLSRRSHIIGFQPLATGTAEHESALERDFLVLTSFLDPAASITSQPITLKYRDGARVRRYTPDFLVRRSLGHSLLVEVKYREDLRQHWDRYQPAFIAARTWAREQGAMFHFATERRIRGPRLGNARRLLPLQRAPVDSQVAAWVLATVAESDAPTFGGVLAAVPAGRRAGLATIWILIARGALRVDLSSLITMDSRLSLP